MFGKNKHSMPPPPPMKKGKVKTKTSKMPLPPTKKKVKAKKTKMPPPPPKKKAKVKAKKTKAFRIQKIDYKPKKPDEFSGMNLPDYDNWTLSELKNLARDLDIKGYGNKSQNSLIRALKQYQLRVEERYLKKKNWEETHG